jgi:riboflavin synthase alpha subunit
MFTGNVEETGEVESLARSADARRLRARGIGGRVNPEFDMPGKCVEKIREYRRGPGL